MRCNFLPHALAVGDQPPVFSWGFAGGGSADAVAQSAYQVRVFGGQLVDHENVLWDSGQVESPRHADIVYGGQTLPGQKRLTWAVRVWDQHGQVSDWSEAGHFEVGRRGREDFAGRWIGPSSAVFSDPLPPLGVWIAPPASAKSSAGELTLRRSFDLPSGYPRCFGMAWLAADAECRLELNGKPLTSDTPFSRDEATPIRLPWSEIRTGENTLAVIGPASALAAGVSLGARIHEAGSGNHDVFTDASWNWIDGECKTPVAVLGDRLPAPEREDNGPRHAIELQREFEIDPKDLDAARLYITGLGCYEASINGQRVGDEIFAPGWTDFETRMHYAAHDVTGLLKAGTNHLQVTLGNGWWGSGMGWESLGKSARPGQSQRLLLDLVALDSADQSRLLVSSDEQWRWRPASTSRNTMYHGQCTDLFAEPQPWQPVRTIDDDFLPRLEPSLGEPIRVTQELQPRDIRQLPGGAWLFDLGQNHAGRPRLRFDVPAGTVLSLTHCEELDADGLPYFENYRTAAVTDRVTVGNEPLDWSPTLTYRGYRYAILTGLPEGHTPTADQFTSQVLHNDVAVASRFACSNDLLNQIDGFVRWGLRSNMHSVPTDCPQRDERLGWTGDVNLFAATSCWLNDMRGFYRKWLLDIFDAQLSDGQVMHTAPYDERILPPESAPVWADIITVLPTVLHLFYDDRTVLAQAYEPMKRWIDWYATQASDGLALVGGFGDWVSLEDTPPPMVGAAYYAYSSRLVAEAARELGHTRDAERYAAQAHEAAAAFHRHYFDPAAGTYTPDTQTAQTLGLALDLTPEPLRQQVADHLADLVEQRGDKPATGFVGTALLLPVLSRYGHHDLAYRVLNTREFPSLGYMIDQRATTVWERWNSDKEGPDMNSRNHFCLGAMAQWLYEDLVGIRPDAAGPGMRRLQLQPRPVGDVTFAEFSYAAPQGTIELRWELVDGELMYDVTLPPNTTADVRLPTGDPTQTRLESDATDSTRIEADSVGGESFSTLVLGPGHHRLHTPAAAKASVGSRRAVATSG